MILERTVYDVRCSKCARLIASGHESLSDAKREERMSAVDVNGEEVALCTWCEEKKKGEVAR